MLVGLVPFSRHGEHVTTFLEHFAPLVDRVVAVASGSSDGTAEAFRAAGVDVHSSEGEGPGLLGSALERWGASAIFELAPAERVEPALAQRLRGLAAECLQTQAGQAFWLRELWDGVEEYRIDGARAFQIALRLYPAAWKTVSGRPPDAARRVHPFNIYRLPPAGAQVESVGGLRCPTAVLPLSRRVTADSVPARVTAPSTRLPAAVERDVLDELVLGWNEGSADRLERLCAPSASLVIDGDGDVRRVEGPRAVAGALTTFWQGLASGAPIAARDEIEGWPTITVYLGVRRVGVLQLRVHHGWLTELKLAISPRSIWRPELWRAIKASPGFPPRVASAAPSAGALGASVVMPFFKRHAELARVFPMHARFFARKDVEVLLVLDEPSQEREVLAFVRSFPQVQWRLLVNDHEHAWRPPCAALNVGIRHARGANVLVMSPESACVTDLPGFAATLATERPGVAALGDVVFSTFSRLEELGGNLSAARQSEFERLNLPPLHYGSLVAPREALLRIRGYDESFTDWGGDDDNVRARLLLDGTPILVSSQMQVLHLSESPRQAINPQDVPITTYRASRIYHPAFAAANLDDWGKDFGRVAFDWS